MAPSAEVLVDGELGEDAPALHHLGEAAADDDGIGSEVMDSPSKSTEPLVIRPRWTGAAR
jgi:hypothetical protein